MSRIEEVGFGILMAIFVFFVVLVLFVLFVVMPVRLYTDAECLRAGYPRSAVSVGLERYCLNLEGSVTVRVDKVGKEKVKQ